MTAPDDQKILWEAVIEIAHLRAEYTSAYVDRKQKAWRKSSWTSADADRFEREAVQQWNANHPALIALWKFQKAHAEALKVMAPATEDPAPHTHTDDCMCEMYDLDVIGARECSSCGGHTGGPCGSRCAVAHDEIVKREDPAPREPRVFPKGSPEPDGVEHVTDPDGWQYDRAGQANATQHYWRRKGTGVMGRPCLWTALNRRPLTEVLLSALPTPGGAE